MKFFCDQCNAQYMIADEKVGPRGVKVKCKKCSHIIVVKGPSAGGDATTVDTPSASAAAASAPAPAAAAAAPRRTEAEISGAFDSLFGGGAAGGSAAAEGAWSSNPTVVAKSPLTAAASEKEWYVAIDDAQVGPIDIAEVQQRWDGKEISEDSLAWKAGMPDWIPVAEIPELSYLVTERPQKAKGAVSSTAGSAAAAKSAAAIEWKPSAASALSSLVQEELIAAKAPKEVATSRPPDGVPDLGLPSFGANDLFGGKVGGASVPAPPDSFGGGGGAAWSVPSGRPASSSAKPLYFIMGGVGLVVVLILVVMLVMLMKGGVAPQQVAMAPQRQTIPAPSAPAAAPPTVTPAPAPAPAAAAGNEDDEGDEPQKGGGKKPKHAKKAKAGGSVFPTHEAAPPEAPPPAAGPPPKPTLAKEDIWGVVRANASRAAPCLKAARGKNEIPAGKYTFILDWVIRPNGGVADPKVKGPPEVLRTSLPGCFASVMGQWRFPASQAGAPIANFPFGPINVP